MRKYRVWIDLAIVAALVVAAFVTGYRILISFALLYLLATGVTRTGSGHGAKKGVTRLSKICRISTPEGRKNTTVCLIDATTRGSAGVIVELGGRHYAHWQDVDLDGAKARADELWPGGIVGLSGYWAIE